jgi:hypothetical protein
MTPRRRRLVALLCVVALVGAALAVHDPGGGWALLALSPALGAGIVVVRRLPAPDSPPPSFLLASDARSRAPPLT